MQLFLDSADPEEIREALSVYSLDGVTTNPTILARSGAEDPAARLKEIRGLLGDRLLFVQLTSLRPNEAAEEARRLRAFLGEPLCLKIPACAEAFPLLQSLSAAGFRLCATAVYTVGQAVLAAHAGASYIAPYISHIDNLSLDGPGLAAEMQNTLRVQGYPAVVLGASFRVASQVTRLAALGVGAATVTLPMLRLLAHSPSSDEELESFITNWQKAYGSRRLLDYLP